MATRAARLPSQLAAYVLHRYDWSETSLILDLFTRDLGRVAVIAKGAKRPYSQLRPVLLPFQRLLVSLGKPPKAGSAGGENLAEVSTLRGAEWAGGTSMLTGAALFSGFYLNELLMKLLQRHDPHPALFDAYAQTLPMLVSDTQGEAETGSQAALRAFELSLLKELGVLPDLSLVTLTQQFVEPQRHYSLVPEAGVTEPRVSEGSLSGDVLIGLQAALQHGSLAALQHACSRGLPELRAALRGLLHYHLGTPQLRTRQVMLDLQSL
jgi:DNA repair protein RecO (recombination protein O)